MRNTVRMMSVFVILLLTGTATEGKKAEQEVTWHSFNEGLAQAQTTGKPLIIDFYTDWCHWCKVMDEKTFSEKQVAAYLKKNYVCVRINAEATDEVINFQGQTFNPVQFTQAFGVRGFPALAFLDKNQEPITIIPGYIPPDTFIKMLEYIQTECYRKQISLDEYMKKEKCSE